jgi:hypothetical protein
LENHKRLIDTKLFASFVEESIPVSEEHFKKEIHLPCAVSIYAIKCVAHGLDLWERGDGTTPSDMLRRFVLKRYGHIFTNNQGTERANKDQNNAHSNQRQEASVSARVSATSWIREQCKASVLGEKKIPWRGK